MLRDWFDVLRYLAAALIILMGLHFLGVIRIGFLNRSLRAEPGDTANLGLGGRLSDRARLRLRMDALRRPRSGGDPVHGGLDRVGGGGGGMTLLFAYGIGMTLPFVLAAGFVGPFMRLMRRFRKHLGKVEKVMGAALVVFGVLIATNALLYVGPVE